MHLVAETWFDISYCPDGVCMCHPFYLIGLFLDNHCILLESITHNILYLVHVLCMMLFCYYMNTFLTIIFTESKP